MEAMNNWIEKDSKLYRKFEFKDFKEAMVFINQISVIAEELNHHPTIHNTYNTVELFLSTHDAGNIVTDKDLTLANRISALL